MDKFFELLPFIIAAIYFFGRSKKKDGNAEKPKPQPRRRPSMQKVPTPRRKDAVPTLEDILRELSGENMGRKKPESQPQTEMKSTSESPSFKKIERPSRTRKPITPIKKLEVIEDVSDLGEETVNSDFDLEQAIIAQTILEKKYI
jgi:hypothetical protein